MITDGFDDQTANRVVAALRELPDAAVQLRAKRLDGRALYDAARTLRAIAPVLVVNDRADVALAAGADGVHLPERGIGVAAARALVGDRLVGVSTHARDEAIAAARAGADYVVYGPVWPTAGKGAPVGIDALAAVVRACAPVPVFALGGVDAERARAAVAVGARVACIGAVLGRSDAAAGARALAAAIG
ncbi:MAG: thiamine phosphate synthase [Polyangia bacterium]